MIEWQMLPGQLPWSMVTTQVSSAEVRHDRQAVGRPIKGRTVCTSTEKGERVMIRFHTPTKRASCRVARLL